MFDDYDHITISYHHRDDGWFEMELYLPLLVDCPKNKIPFNIHYTGAKTTGTFNPSTKAFTEA